MSLQRIEVELYVSCVYDNTASMLIVSLKQYFCFSRACKVCKDILVLLQAILRISRNLVYLAFS